MNSYPLSLSGATSDPFAAQWAEIVIRLYEAREFEDAAEIAMSYLLALTGMGSIVVYYSALEEDWPLQLIGQQFAPDSPVAHADPLFSDESVARESIVRREVIVTQDAEQAAPYTARMLRRNVRTGVTIPLIAHEEAIGVMQLAHHLPNQFPIGQLAHVMLIAQHLALSMNNIVLRQREQRSRLRAEILQQVALVALSSNDPTDAINVTLQLLQSTLPFERVVITLQPELMHQLPLLHHTPSGLFSAFEQMPIAGEVIDMWSALRLPDVAHDPRWEATKPFYPEVYTYIGAPLLRSDRILGVLNVMSSSRFAFHEDDTPLVQTVANHLADMLEKSHIFQRMERREKIADDLVLMGVVLGASLDEQELLTLMCEQCAPIFGVHSASVWLLKDEMLRCASAFGAGSAALLGVEQELRSAHFTAQILKTRRPLFLNRVARLAPRDPLWSGHVKAQSLLGVPFMWGNDPIGVLVLADTINADRFSPDDLEQLHLFGMQAALAIVNARLFAEAQRRVDQLRLVNEIGRIAASDFLLERLFERVSNALFKEFQYHAISLFVINENNLELYAYRLNQPTDQTNIPEPLARRLPQSAAYRAWQKGELELNTEQPTLSVLLGVATTRLSGYQEAALPLIIADDVIGVLNFERQTPITTEELDVLESLASQMAFSVSNTRLFEIIQLQVVELDTRVQQQTLALREQRDHIEAILQSVADAVIITDLEGQIISKNPAAERFIMDAAQATKGLQTLYRTIATLTAELLNSQKAEHTLTLELGPLALQAKAARVREADHDAGTVIVLRDITPLREIDKLKTQFVSTVSHELRTPLSNIKLYLKLLQTGKPEKRTTYQEILDAEATRLERLISNLLDLTRLDQGLPRRTTQINLLDVIRANVQLNQAMARERGVSLTFSEPAQPPPPVLADKDQIAQVLINLISNALNYTAAGGQIVVRCLDQHDNQPPQVRVEVQDTGIGIGAADLERIFDRFYRGKNVSENLMPGTGLGLSICKEIIALHNGTIGVESELGQGSTFWFTLPLDQPSSKQP
jgi:signal transduction histidine kinase/transcriptional regulator with GAF, ATPase, and Fis domain